MLYLQNMRNTKKMSNKTAVQIAYDYFKSEMDKSALNIRYSSRDKEVITNLFEGLLITEKQQIMKAYDDGGKVEYDFLINNQVLTQSEDYYNSKYGNNGTTN